MSDDQRSPIDISVPLQPGLPVWPGDPEFELAPVLRIERGEGANVSRLSLSSHGGTHVDAPWHMLPAGDRLERVDLRALIGLCLVADLTAVTDQITRSDLEATLGAVEPERLLLKTRNSRLWDDPRHSFERSFVGLSAEGATWLVQRGVRLLGIDYHSIEPFDGDGATHQILLEQGVVILETLDLHAVSPGRYQLICLPLSIPGADGAPCRAILLPAESETS